MTKETLAHGPQQSLDADPLIRSVLVKKDEGPSFPAVFIFFII